ncbi:MAG: hypothetical protein HKN79_04545 [Flavobacteriales bacterium]|nr:hypothetical protein [Flavobacteriales bacterium]
MRSLKHIIVFCTCTLLAGLLLGFAVDRSADARCEGYEVHLLGDPALRFVTPESLSAFVHEHGHTIEGRYMREIDTYGIESDLLTIPFIENATVYKTIDRKVEIAVSQRVPVMRLFYTDGTSCYVDDTGRMMELCETFSYKCMPVTGLDRSSGTDAENDQLDKHLKHLWSLALYVRQNDFWNAQILQVDIDPEKGAVLIPRVGNHQIILGEVQDYMAKLDKLKEFYDQGIDQTNWNIYRSLDLRYEGQVIGVKR